MAVSVRAVSAASAPTATTEVNVSSPTGVVAGDLLIAVHGCDTDAALTSMTAPSGWTQVASDSRASVGRMKVWTKTATSSEPSSYTFPDSGTADSSVVILAVTGHDAAAPLAVAPTFQGSATAATSHPAPSVTGVANGLLVTGHFAGGSVDATRTYTPPSGMTEQADTNGGGWVALEVNTLGLAASGATGSKAATCSLSTPYTCLSLVVAPDTGGGGGGGGGGAVTFRAASEDSRGTTNAPAPAPPTGTAAGDLLLAFQVSDYRGTLAAMTAPADWAEVASNSTRSVDVGFVKIWQKTATAAEPASYTFNDSASATSDVVVVALTGWDVTDAFVVDPTWNSGAAQTTHATQDVTGVAGGMLLTAHIAGTNGTTRTYTSGPSGMTLAQDAFLSTSGYVTENVYYQALSAAGAVGSKIATLAASAPFVTVALVVQPPGPKTIIPSAIDTAEAFGSPTVTVSAGPQTVSPTGIASAEAIGTPVVTVAGANQVILVVGIGPAVEDTAFGTSPFGSSPFGIAVIHGGEIFGVPTVSTGLLVLPDGIASAEVFGTPTVTVPPDPASIGSLYPGPDTYPGATTYPDSTSPANQTVTPIGIATGETLGVPVVTVALGDQTVRVTQIDSAEAFGVPTVTVDAPTLAISPIGIASEEAFGRAFVFVEVPPPVPTGADTYFIDGIDLTSYAWRIETAEGLQVTPGVVGDDIVLPGLDGAVEVFGGPGQQRRPDAIGRIVFSLWLKGVDPTTGLVPGGSTTATEYFTRWDTLVRLFHRRRVTIDHVKADGTIRRAVAHLLPGDSITPSRVPSSPWFGRFKATFAIPAAHWTDTSTVTTGQQALTTGSTLSLSAFAGATAPCTELTVIFGAGSNPKLTANWGFVGWNDVITAGRQLGIDTATGTTNQAAGTSWTPGYGALTFSPGPRLFEIDPSEALSATLTHTGGGSMTVEVSGKRRYRTS